jgi:hypothetical protein
LSYLDDIKFFPDDGIFFLPGRGLGTVAGNTLAVYMMWFVPYVSWMALIGMKLPKRGWDTVFHSLVRGGPAITIGKVCWGRPASVSKKQMESDDFELRDFFAYMLFHAFLVFAAVYLIAYPCYRYKPVHAVLLICMTILCVERGAQRYKYYVTDMYGRSIRKEFASLLKDTKLSKVVVS